MKKRLLSTMLALCLVLTMLPLNALATDELPVEGARTEIQADEVATPEDSTSITPTEVTTDESIVSPGVDTVSELEVPPKGDSDTQSADFGNEQGISITQVNEVFTSGYCGPNAKWKFENGTLIISGTGPMADFADLEFSDTGYSGVVHTNLVPWNPLRAQINNVVIESGITSIGDGAFYSSENDPTNDNLKSVVIPDSVIYIGDCAFTDCQKMTTITMSNSVRNIGIAAFEGCTSLTNITIPKTVTNIGIRAFYNCTSLANVIIPYGITSIKNVTFSGCTALKNITIPLSVTSVGQSAFSGCSNLKDVYYGSEEADWKNISIGLGNEYLTDAEVHFTQSTRAMFHSWNAGDIPMRISWNWDDLNGTSSLYKYNLATTGLVLSAAAEKSQKCAEEELQNLGFEIIKSKNFDVEWSIFSPGVTFGCKTINGEYIFAIVVRGTKSIGDKITDILSVVDNFSSSAIVISSQFDTFVKEDCKLNPEEVKNKSKFFVTGHSLGGAVANRLAKNFNTTFGEDNVFAYTYESPTTRAMPSLFCDLNIINILNKEDGVIYLPQLAGFRYGREYRFHRNTLGEKFTDTYRMLTGRDFNNEDAHAVEVCMSYILASDLGNYAYFSGTLCRIACPVDVEVYTSEGQLAGKVVNNAVESTVPEKVFINIENDIKYIYLLDNDDYTLNFTGTDTGMMEYTVQGLDLSECTVTNEKIFANVALTNGKKMSSKVSVWDKTDDTINTENKIDVPEVQLFMTDEDGNAIKEILPDGNGTEVYISRTVTFNANGGTVNPTTMTTGTNGKLSNLPTPTRSGYRFRGWYTAANGGTQITADMIFTSDATVYAQWSKANSNGGSGNTGSGTGGNNGGSGSSSNPNGDSTSNGDQNSSSSSGANNIANANKSPATGDIFSIVWLCLLGIFAMSAFAYLVSKKRS